MADDPPAEELTTHAAWLRRLARGLLYDPAAAEDVVQTAWLAALRHGPPREGTQEAWLAGAVRRLALQWRRAEARRGRRERAAARAEALGDPAESLERLELTRLLVDTVSALDEPYRTTLLWRFFDGLSLREIARRRGVPLETARTHLKRGLAQVRRRLDARPSGSRESLLGALLPLAGPMPLALKLGGLAGVKTTLEWAGAIGMSGKAGVAVALAVVLVITIWTLRETAGGGAGGEAIGETDVAALQVETSGDAGPAVQPAPAAASQADEPRRRPAAEDAAPAGGAPAEGDRKVPADSSFLDLTVAGRVQDVEGHPIAGVNVSTGGEGVLTDVDGIYELGLSAFQKTAYVEAKAPGWSQARKIVENGAAGELIELDFELRPEFRVVGRVLDEFGNPLEGAQVSSFYTHGNEARTAFDGSFTLGSLDPGRPEHSVTARKDGYVLATERLAVDGRKEAELVLTLARGVRVSGLVVDEEGQPLPGAELYIGFSPHAYNRLDALADEHGAFAFPAVGRGAQTLVTQLKGRAADHRRILVPEKGEVYSGLRIVLRSGSFLGGRVVDAEDAPLEGLRVTARHHGEYVEHCRATTDADGRFRLEHLPDSDVSLEVYGRGIVQLHHDVPELDREDLVLRAERAAKVAGTVLDGPSGTPLTSFRIRFVDPVLAEGDRRAWGYSASWVREGHLFTEDDGTWDSGGNDLTAGTVIGIEASAPGYGPGVAERVVASADPDPASVVIALWPEAVVRGTVVSAESGEPVSGAAVKRFSDRQPLRPHDSDDVHRRLLAETDSHGRFELRGVPAGEMSLAVEHGEFALQTDGPFEVSGQGPVQERLIALGAGARLFGRVLDADGAPLAGELVRLESSDGDGRSRRRWEQETDPDGGFSFARLPAGAYELAHRLVAPAGSGVPAIALRVEVPEGGELERDLVPRGTCTLVGGLECDVELPDGIGVSAKPVVAEGQRAGSLLFRGTLTRDGRFELRGLEPGPYDLFVTHYDSQAGHRQFHGHLRAEVGARATSEVWIPVIVVER